MASCGSCNGSTSSVSPSSRPTPAVSGSIANGVFPQDVTVTGFFSGHITSGYGSCIKSAEAFQGYVIDAKAGSPLAFDFNIPLAAYHGPGTYGPNDGNPQLGTVYMAGQVSWTAQSGTFTVNPGEKGGSIQIHLVAGPSFAAEDISGTWRCG